MRIHTISIAIFSLVLLSCQEPKEDEESQEVEKISLEQSVLNVNIATKDDLTSLGISEELSKALLEKRPFLNMIQLDELLSEIDNKDELYEIIYVPQNLNTTEKVNFKLIPGVGERMANRFEKYRPYSSMKQFRRAISKYVEHEEIARFEQYVFVPIELNTASEESIKALPGFGDRIADEFKANRPYSSMEQFRKALGEHLDSKELSRLERLVYLKEAK